MYGMNIIAIRYNGLLKIRVKGITKNGKRKTAVVNSSLLIPIR
jgi:hypothetical protein